MNGNRVLIAAFGIASGIYKAVGGEADIQLFANVGVTAVATALFGVLQAGAGALLLARRQPRAAALVLAACNAFASYVLFVAEVQPFGVISLVFVGMALVAARERP